MQLLNDKSASTALVPWVAVALLLAVCFTVNGVIDLQALGLTTMPPFPGALGPGSSPNLSLVVTHAQLRIGWGVSALGYALTAIGVLSCTLIVLYSVLAEQSGAVAWRLLAVLVVPALAILYFVAFSGLEIMSEPAVLRLLRVHTLYNAMGDIAGKVDTFFDRVTYSLFLLLTVAVSALLAPLGAGASEPSQLARRLRALHALLYAGSAALVMRALEMYLYGRWLGAWLSPLDAAAIDRLVLAVSAAHGAFYSAILLLLYLPAALILRVHANRLAIVAVRTPGAPRERWLARSGLATSPFQELAHLALAIAPLLAGGVFSKAIDLFVG